jgi:DNA polymerase
MIPNYLLTDFESRSFCKLRGKASVSGRVYAQHPSTEVLCCTFAEASGEGWDLATLWRPQRYPFDGPLDVVVAHNAIGFDRHIWERTLGWPAPRRWLDSAILARRAGYASSGLEELGERYGVPKDKEGNKLTVGLSRNKAGRYVRAITPEIRERVMAYCEADVGTMIRVFEDLCLEFDFALYPDGTWQADEERVYETDLRALDRGIAFDELFALALLRQEALAAEDACADAGLLPSQVKSVKQFKAIMAAEGWDIPNAKRATIEGIDHPAVAARLACTSITAGKLQAGRLRVTDGRLRDMAKVYGAHTWRWSGQGMQTQNLPRGAAVPDGTYERVLSA